MGRGTFATILLIVITWAGEVTAQEPFIDLTQYNW